MVKLLVLLGIGNLGLSGFILYQLNKLRKEINSNMNQARINDLTTQLRAGNNSAEDSAAREKTEVAAAINNPNIDTSELEAEIARNSRLAALFEGIYTPPTTEPAPAPEETPSTGGGSETGSTGTGSTEGGLSEGGATAETGAETGAGEPGSTDTGSTENNTVSESSPFGTDSGSASDLSESTTGEFPAGGSDTISDPNSSEGSERDNG